MRNLFSATLVLALGLFAFEANAIFPQDTAAQALLTRANNVDPLPGIGNYINRTKNMARYTYDFSVLGSPSTSTFLVDDQGINTPLPKGAIVTNVVANVMTQPLPSTTSIALGLLNTSTTDLMATKAQSSLTVGFVAGVPVGTAATWDGPVVSGYLPTSGGSNVEGAIPFMTLTGSALTAGKIEWFVEYVIQ